MDLIHSFVIVCVRHAALLIVVLLGACASLPTDYEKEPSSAIRDTGNALLAQKSQPLVAAHPGESGFYMLSDGIEAMAARLLLAQKSEVAIDVQY